MRVFISLVLLGSLSLFGAGSKVEYDKSSGLKIAKGFEIVRANCTACHSAKFITFQRGDRDTWLAMIRWMQRTQGLWQFDAKTEDTILTYLETNYPPGKSSRRPNLKPNELPPKLN